MGLTTWEPIQNTEHKKSLFLHQYCTAILLLHYININIPYGINTHVLCCDISVFCSSSDKNRSLYITKASLNWKKNRLIGVSKRIVKQWYSILQLQSSFPIWIYLSNHNSSDNSNLLKKTSILLLHFDFSVVYLYIILFYKNGQFKLFMENCV